MKKNILVTQIPSGEELLNIMRSQNRPLRIDALLRAAGLNRHAKKDLEKELSELAEKDVLLRMPGGLWVLKEKLKIATGLFHALENGGGILKVEGRVDIKEIYIPPAYTHGAWHLDLCQAALVPATHGKQGKIIEIMERSQNGVVARVEKIHSDFLLCRPLDKKISCNFKVNLKNSAALKKDLVPGIVVLLKPEKFIKTNLWKAELLEVISQEERIAAQEAIVKVENDVPFIFPKLALRQAAEAPKAIEEKDFKDREDLRHLPFVTIDGADAKDFDDAVHVEKTATGWTLRVAIADVSHYVRPDPRQDSLDSEARRRGNSWYFPQSVEPMLPHELSDNICSLVPTQDRLAFMCELSFDHSGHRVASRFSEIVMRSHKRLIYEKAEIFFSMSGTKPPVDADEQLNKSLSEMLSNAYELYKILAQTRRDRGSLDFDLPEPAYKFTSEGMLEDITIAQRGDSNKLIEEFMIAANEAVADKIGASDVPFLYRVHPQPEAIKLKALYETLKLTTLEALPRDVIKDNTIPPSAVVEILRRAQNTPQEYVVNRLCLQSMQQARYQPTNEGHFGLASPAYCHFTSPIRRYADLVTHRALKKVLGIKGYDSLSEQELFLLGGELSKLERKAIDCERAMARRLGCVFFEDREGEVLKGTISGVMDFGLFVELDAMPCEGLINVRELKGDWFVLDKERHFLVGKRSGRVFRLGDSIDVRVIGVDMKRLEIQFAPANLSYRKKTKRKKKATANK